MMSVSTVHSRVLPYPLGRSRTTLTDKLDRSAKLTESRCVVRRCSRRNDESSLEPTGCVILHLPQIRNVWVSRVSPAPKIQGPGDRP